MIKLFSEKVDVTFTNSDQNILQVENFEEIFFDVYEFEIYGKKFIAEKIADYLGNPVVKIPVIKDGKKFESQFVLKKGKLDVLYNPENKSLHFVTKEEALYDKDLDLSFVEDFIEDNDYVFEDKKEELLEQIQEAKLAALDRIKLEKKEQFKKNNKRVQEEKLKIASEIKNIRTDLLEDFHRYTLQAKDILSNENNKREENLTSFIENYIENTSKSLQKKIHEDSVDNFQKASADISKLASDLKIVLEKNSNSISTKVSNKIDTEFEELQKIVESKLDNESIKLKESFKNDLLAVESASVELKDFISKSTNRALSRIGNIRTELERTINTVSNRIDESVVNNDLKIQSFDKQIKDLIDLTETNIRSYYDKKLSIIQESLDKDNKDEILALINESKQSILNEVSKASNTVVVKESKSDLDKLKKQFEKLIGSKFTAEIQSLKRLIELSSGGGSVAKQFADGGTMTGDIDFDNAGITNANSITFNTSLETVPSTGEIGWNSADGTLELGLNNSVPIPIGEKEVVYVKAAQDIKNGQCVYASDASGGGSGNIIVSLFSAAGVVDELRFLGIATQDINTNEFGYVATFGKIKSVLVANTRGSDDPQHALPTNQGWGIGTILYVSATTPGHYTSTPPTPPHKRMPIALVIAENGNQRILFARAEHGYDLDELHNVNIVNPQNNQILTYNKTLSTWNNTSNLNVSSLSATSLSATTIHALSSFVEVIDIKQYELSGFNVKGDATVQGSISATGNLVVDTDTLYVDSVNDRVGIGTGSPAAVLHVDGDVLIGDDLSVDGVISTSNSSAPSSTLRTRMYVDTDPANPAVGAGFLDLNAANTRLFIGNSINKVNRLDLRYVNNLDYVPSLTLQSRTLNGVSNITFVKTEQGTSPLALVSSSAYGEICGEVGTVSPAGHRSLNFNTYSSSEDRYSVEGQYVFDTKNAAVNWSSGQHHTAWKIADAYVGVIDSNGNFGIGTASPSYKLDVNGDANIADNLTVDTDTLYVDSANDRVGIGTATPSKKLEIQQSADNDGILIAGYDDNSSRNLQIYIHGNGRAYFGGTASALVFDGAQNYFSATGSSYFDLQTGTAKLIIRDQTYTNVAHITETGGAWFSDTVGIGTDSPSYKLDVNGDVNIATSLTVGTDLDVGGHFSATTKSFLINNPAKEGKKLQYGVVESNQHSVFVRGKTSDDIIVLPEEWEWLVHQDSVTVQLTPVGRYQQLFVISQNNNEVKIGGVAGKYNYTIYGERKDVAKLETEV